MQIDTNINRHYNAAVCWLAMPAAFLDQHILDTAPPDFRRAGHFSVDNDEKNSDHLIVGWGGFPAHKVLRLLKWIHQRLNEPLALHGTSPKKRGIQVRVNPSCCRPYRRYRQVGTCPDGALPRQQERSKSARTNTGFSLALLPGGSMRRNPFLSATFAAAVSNTRQSGSKKLSYKSVATGHRPGKVAVSTRSASSDLGVSK